MRKIINFFKAAATKVKSAVNKTVNKARVKAYHLAVKLEMKRAEANMILASNRGENFVDSGIKILIAVVIGALLLGGLYALFGDTIMPTVTEKVEEMFEFNG